MGPVAYGAVPTLPDDFDAHPARDASLASMRAVEAGDRDAWLALFAPDAVVEDPIGTSPFDPEGLGHRGAEAIAAFYDSVIGPNEVRFRIEQSWAAGDEVANVGTITTTMPDGTVVHTDGVFTYRVDAEGRVVALRAYWELARLRFGEA
jgi:ketosteroid isomerase-like protein